MNEFQLTLTNYTARQGISISELAKCVGYDPFFFEKILIGKNRQIPVDFFIRIADVLNLTTREQDTLVGAWAFGVDRWNWSPEIRGSPKKACEEDGKVKETVRAARIACKRL